MKSKLAILALAAALLTATVAMAADDKVLGTSRLYNESAASMKLNEGAYDKMLELKGNFWVWCKEGYDIVADAELTPGAVTYAAINPTFAKEAQTAQIDVAAKAVMRFLPEKKFAIKATGGKHKMDVAIVRDEMNIAGGMWSYGASGWTYAAETKVTDEAGNVLFRGLLKIQDTSWQAAPNKWAKDFAEVIGKMDSKLVKGFGGK
jgi:hypothetical protein